VVSIKNIFSFLFLFLSPIFLFSQSKLPKALEIPSEFNSVDDEVKGINVNTVSPKVAGSAGRYPKVSENLNNIELERISRFVSSEVSKPEDKRLVVARYGVEESKATDLFLEAKGKGFKEVRLVIDINRAINIDYSKWPTRDYINKKGEPKTVPVSYFNDVNEAFDKGIISWKTNAMGKEMKRLMDGGFRLNPKRSSYGLYSPGIYYNGGGKITPIMHLKETFLIDESKGTIRYNEATFNWSKKKRFNRLMEYREQKFIPNISATSMNRPSYSYAHIKEAIKLFSENKPYKEIKKSFEFHRVRFLYKNGSYQEPMYNLGTYNQNERLESIVNSEKAIKEINLSHFVSTNTPVTKALHARLKSDPKFKLTGILDSKFIGWIRSYGLFQTLAGYSAIRPGRVPDLYINEEDTKSFRDQVEFKVYSRVTGQQKFIDEYPLVEYLWHDKSHVVYYEDKSGDLFYGSMNLSNNHRNTDLQTLIHYPDDISKSDVAKSFKNVNNQALKGQTAHLLTIEEAVFKNTICYFTGLGYDEVTNVRVKKMMKALEEKKTKAFFEYLNVLAKTPRDHVIGLEKASTQMVEDRVRQLEKIIAYYKVKVDPLHKQKLRIWLPYMMTAMSHPDLSSYDIEVLMNLSFIKDSKNYDPMKVFRYVKDTWEFVKPNLEAKLDYFKELNKDAGLKRSLKAYMGKSSYKTWYREEDLKTFPRWHLNKKLKELFYSICSDKLTAK